MSSGITLTAATRQNLLSLQGTADLLSSTQNHLSTGKKVNSALDSPVNFFTAQALNNRSKDLSGLLDGISNGIQAIQAANQGITSIQKLVDSAKSTANQALATKSTAAGASATSAVVSTTRSLSSALTTANGGTGAAADGTHDFSGGNVSKFTVTDATGKNTTVTLDASHFGNTVADVTKVGTGDILTQINSQLIAAGGQGAQVQASLTTDGRLNFTSTGTGTDASVSVIGVAGPGGSTAVDIGLGTSGFAAIAAKGIDPTDGSTKANASGAVTSAIATAGAGVDLTAGTGDASLTIQLGSGAKKTITLNSGVDSTLTGSVKADVIATAINKQINADTGLSGKVVAVGDLTTGKISLHSTVAGADQKLTAAATSATTTDIGFGLGTSATTIAAGTVTASGAGSTSANGTNARTALAKQFNDLLTQITQQAQDSSYNGVNLLYRSGSDPKENTLHISFNEKDTSSLDIKGTKLDATGLGITNVTGDFASDDDIKTALSQLTNASSTLRTQSSTFGSNLTVVQNRQDFSKQLTNILDTGAANLTNADLNEEAANSQALSTRQSIGISALSLANTAQQGILQLLR